MGQLVHVDAALEELGLELEDFVEFLGDLKEFIDEALPQLKSAIDSKTFVDVREHAHSIKGAVANLRFVAAAEIAHKLEKMGLNSVDEGLVNSYEDLVTCLDASFAEVNG
jgi:HPt (histidine-containing phosphotransfer) domain-containing protein